MRPTTLTITPSHHLQLHCVPCDLTFSLMMHACVIVTGSRSTLKKKQFEISTNDRVSVFIELADAYRQLGQQVHILPTLTSVI